MRKTILILSAFLCIGFFAAFSLIPASDPGLPQISGDDFKEFLSQFKQETLPYAITKESLQQHIKTSLLRDGKSNGYWKPGLKDPNGFLPNSRMDYMSRVPIHNEPVSRLENEQFVAVVYASTRGFTTGFKQYRIAVFDKSGTYIAGHNLAGTGISHLNAATVNADLKAVIQSYQINWEKDLDENGTDGNKITGLSLESAREVDLTTPSEEDKWFDRKPKKQEVPEEKSIGAAGI